MLPVSQKDAGGRLLRALRSVGPEVSRIALGARTAIAASDVLPTTIFEQLVRMQVESDEQVTVLVACACAFNAAVADCGASVLAHVVARSTPEVSLVVWRRFTCKLDSNTVVCFVRMLATYS